MEEICLSVSSLIFIEMGTKFLAAKLHHFEWTVRE
jgi:hypothetical protein